MKLNLHIRLTPVLSTTCIFLSLVEIIAWAIHFPSDLHDTIVGGCIAILYPWVDLYRRTTLQENDLFGFLSGALCMGVPLLAVTVIHQTLPMLVICAVFFTAAVYHYPAKRLLDRALLGTAFLLLWGLVGRAALGREWMNLEAGHLRLLFTMIPAAVLTTIYAGQDHR